MNKSLSTLVQNEVTRKEFLAIIGFGVISIMGFGTLIELLTGKSLSHRPSASVGYGSGAYGGQKKD